MTEPGNLEGAQKLAKVKVADKLSFPLALDLAPLVVADAAHREAALAGPQQYDLAAILIHKGPSASHGHYGARVSRCPSLLPWAACCDWALRSTAARRCSGACAG